jgi:serine/threonine-protein kinase RIO1
MKQTKTLPKKKIKAVKETTIETEGEFNAYYKGFDDGYNTAVRIYKTPTSQSKGSKKQPKSSERF